jgi:hypothetical protein
LVQDGLEEVPEGVQRLGVVPEVVVVEGGVPNLAYAASPPEVGAADDCAP